MRLKQFLFESNSLAEGIGQVKKQYVNTGKINAEDLHRIKYGLEINELGDAYAEWVARTMVANNIAKTTNKNKRAEFMTSLLDQVLTPYNNMKTKGYKKTLPEKQTLQKLIQYIEKEINTFYKSKKVDVGNLKQGQDYEFIHKEGPYEVYKVITYDAMHQFGLGTKWCVTKCKTWNDYMKRDACFYYIRDFSRNSSDPLYKTVAHLQTGSKRKIIDAEDLPIHDLDHLNFIDKLKWFEAAPTFELIPFLETLYDEVATTLKLKDWKAYTNTTNYISLKLVNINDIAVNVSVTGMTDTDFLVPADIQAFDFDMIDMTQDEVIGDHREPATITGKLDKDVPMLTKLITKYITTQFQKDYEFVMS